MMERVNPAAIEATLAGEGAEEDPREPVSEPPRVPTRTDIDDGEAVAA